MNYEFKLTTWHDGALVSTLTLGSAIDAVETFAKCSDYGMAKEYAQYNLFEPNGKCHTKTFYRNGKVVVK